MRYWQPWSGPSQARTQARRADVDAPRADVLAEYEADVVDEHRDRLKELLPDSGL